MRQRHCKNQRDCPARHSSPPAAAAARRYRGATQRSDSTPFGTTSGAGLTLACLAVSSSNATCCSAFTCGREMPSS